jgi:hypothetical protein
LNATIIKEKILENPKNIEKILQYIGCSQIHESLNEYRCAKNKNDTNSTRISVKKDSLISRIYDVTPVKGDILTLIMALKQCNLNETIKICCYVLDISYDYSEEIKPKKIPFGGYYKKIQNMDKSFGNRFLNLKTYSNNILLNFLQYGNKRFYMDNISYETQKKFSICFDEITQRIVVPWKDINGNIIGIMGRYNASADYCESHNIAKWFPIIPHPKSQTLYGLYENYKTIQETGIVYVGESEKFTHQLDTMNYFNGVSCGGHEISPIHRRILLSLKVNIVIAFDNDIPNLYKEKECKFLKSKCNLLNFKVGYINTLNILKDKESPSDNGIETWEKCLNNIVWV